MKVELQQQAMRLHLEHGELSRLLGGESIENLTRFGGNGGWALAVSLHDGDQAVLLDGGTDCRLVLPRAAVQALGDGQALHRALDLDDGTVLQLQVAV